MKKSLDLLDQIIEVAEYEDAIRRRNTETQDYIGEDWTLCHLKSLKELIVLENADSNNNRPNN